MDNALERRALNHSRTSSQELRVLGASLTDPSGRRGWAELNHQQQDDANR